MEGTDPTLAWVLSLSISILLPNRRRGKNRFHQGTEIKHEHDTGTTRIKKKCCSGEIQKSVYFNIFIHTDLYYMRLPKWDPQIIKIWQQAVWDLQWLLKKTSVDLSDGGDACFAPFDSRRAKELEIQEIHHLSTLKDWSAHRESTEVWKAPRHSTGGKRKKTSKDIYAYEIVACHYPRHRQPHCV